MKTNKSAIFLITAILTIIFINLPFMAGKLAETDTLVFRGTYFNTADYSVHLSMMQAGQMREVAYQMRYTSEPHTPAYIRLFYVFLGHISACFNFNVETTFLVSKLLLSFIALFSIFLFLQKAFSSMSEVYYSFLLAIFGSGIGWLQPILGISMYPISPIDFWLIDAYAWFSLSLFPAFALTITLMILSLYLFLGFLEDYQWKKIIVIALLALISQLFNPIAFSVIDIAMVGAVLFAWWQNKKVEVKHVYALIFLAIVQIPLLVYNMIILLNDPVWWQFTLQNETLSPPLDFYFWGFFPFWLFAIHGVLQAIQNKKIVMGAMIFWVLGGFLLAYSPTLIQRRFLLGITIPLSILAIEGLKSVIFNLPNTFENIKKRKNFLYFFYIFIASFSSIIIILNTSLNMKKHSNELFYPSNIKDAAQWLNQNANQNDFVLAGMETSQILGQSTFLKMYIGHEMETLFFDKKESEVIAYYNTTKLDEWLLNTPIKWVVYGPYEFELNQNFKPTISLVLVYENATIKIYKVTEK